CNIGSYPKATLQRLDHSLQPPITVTMDPNVFFSISMFSMSHTVLPDLVLGT
ncbi:hypothetical protein NDU88_005646, partial [Pleurodeles waltl]